MFFAGLFRLADRTHALVLPAAIGMAGLLVFGSLMGATQGGWAREWFAPPQLVGTLVLFTLLPAYLLGVLPVQARRVRAALADLRPAARAPDVARLEARVGRMPPIGWLGPALGIGLGLAQNPEFLERMFRHGDSHPLDVGFLVGACLSWMVVGLVLGWRLPVSSALSRLGRHLVLDLYRLDRLRSLARVATTDILVVAGAMAMTPLQSLDAEFRFGNYIWAVAVGVPAAIALFALPLWGVHRNILQAKQERLASLRETLDGIDRQDVARLEPVAAHLERVRSIPSWPVDLQLAARIFGYVIIPPLAWVAAALVENLVERF